MSSTPIQYTHKPDKGTLQEWRRRARSSEDVFVGLLNDGTVEAKAEKLEKLQKTVAKVQKGIRVVSAVRGFEDGLEEPPPANSAFQLERPATREDTGTTMDKKWQKPTCRFMDRSRALWARRGRGRGLFWGL
eukprot:COSAG06_NODE_21596_length_751_cov_1.680982_1_plen_132_part_00